MHFHRQSVSACAAMVFAALSPASAYACDEWPCFNDTEKPNADQSWKQSQKITLDDYAKNLRLLNASRVIRVNSEQVVSTDLRSLIGNYALVETEGESEVLKPIGSTYKPELREIKIKDESLFKGVVSRSFNLGAKLPVLQIDLGAQDVAELSVDLISAAYVATDANLISCNFPIAFAEDAKSGKNRIVFVSGANVTRVRKQFFKEGNAGGSGAFALLALNGKTYVSDKTILTDYIVLPSFVEARPVDPDLCRGRNLESMSEASAPVTTVAHDVFKNTVNPYELEDILQNQEKAFGYAKSGELRLDAQ